MKCAIAALMLVGMGYALPAGAQVPELYAANAFAVCRFPQPTGCDVNNAGWKTPVKVVPYARWIKDELKAEDAVLVGIAYESYNYDIVVYAYVPSLNKERK